MTIVLIYKERTHKNQEKDNQTEKKMGKGNEQVDPRQKK